MKLEYKENCVSSTTCSHNGDGTAKLIIGLPIRYRAKRIKGVLNHEIGNLNSLNIND